LTGAGTILPLFERVIIIMTSKETRQKFADTYDIIIGRNEYDQNKRQYVYTPSAGKYYSDCSSSGCATYDKIGLPTSLLNTAGMYNSKLFEKVDVQIVNGHIAKSEFSKLRQADALMYVGNDSSRPLQIGHVEYIHTLGADEATTKLCGHGSGTPSCKVMSSYNTARQSSKASNGKAKGLICVLRRIPDDAVKYTKGWNSDSTGWWYADTESSYYKSCWKVINGHKYYFNSAGYAVQGEQTIDGKKYFFVSEKGHDLECALYIEDRKSGDGSMIVGEF